METLKSHAVHGGTLRYLKHDSATTGTPDAEARTLWAVTMELAATTSRGLMLMGVGR